MSLGVATDHYGSYTKNFAGGFGNAQGEMGHCQ
jgi:hypothetical protein